jgi:prepilin-type N-terminal cleavage/methylation domain-containing protein
MTIPQKTGYGKTKGRKTAKMKGFTLLEIIVTLLLVGIMAVMGGMVVVRVFEGYVLTRENAVTAQKAELALSRISREIMEMLNFSADATGILLPMNNVEGRRVIGLIGEEVRMAFGEESLANGATLINQVAAFTLTYYSGTTPHATWPMANDIATLTTIDLSLQLRRSDGQLLPFTSRVVPRNNKNQGGAAPALPPPTAPQYGLQCFIAQAAYENPHGPAVQVLRDFRDAFLAPTAAGRLVTAKYYEYAPLLAKIIAGHTGSKWAAQLFLAPWVALAFLLLYVPFVLLVMLLLPGVIYLLAKGAKKRIGRAEVTKRGARGSILLGLIFTILVMSTLAAAVLPMAVSSWVGQVYAQQGRKAYFLAESGFRWAASQFLNAGSEDAKEAALTAMNNKTCTLLADAGSFTIRVYPYWFRTQAAAAGATTLSTRVSGTIPLEFNGNFPAGRIRVGNNYHSFSQGNGSGATVTFQGLSPALPVAIPASPALNVQPVAEVASAQSLTKGGNLTIEASGAGFFPALNGNFVLDPTPVGLTGGAVFNYLKRVGNRLENVTLADGRQNADWTSPVSVTSGTRTILDRFIHLSSRGFSAISARKSTTVFPWGGLSGEGRNSPKSRMWTP